MSNEIEYLHDSKSIRKQAVLVKLEPVHYHERVYDKLLHLMKNDENPNVRDASYGALVRLARVRELALLEKSVRG